MSIEITLNQIRAHNPCADGWGRLLRARGKTSADDEPFPLTVRAAAGAAARDAMRDRQAAKLSQILTAGEWVND